MECDVLKGDGLQQTEKDLEFFPKMPSDRKSSKCCEKPSIKKKEFFSSFEDELESLSCKFCVSEMDPLLKHVWDPLISTTIHHPGFEMETLKWN